VVRGTDCAKQGEVVKGKRVKRYSPPLGILSLFGRRASARLGLAKGFIRGKGGDLLLPALGGVAFRYFHSHTLTDAASGVQMSASADFFLVFALATYFLCDTASSTALELFGERLIAPLWHRLRNGRKAASTNLSGRIRSLRELLRTSSRCDKNARPCRCIYISHNPPPHIPSISSLCCI
jgi:hypothetical protein